MSWQIGQQGGTQRHSKVATESFLTQYGPVAQGIEQKMSEKVMDISLWFSSAKQTVNQ